MHLTDYEYYKLIQLLEAYQYLLDNLVAEIFKLQYGLCEECLENPREGYKYCKKCKQIVKNRTSLESKKRRNANINSDKKRN